MWIENVEITETKICYSVIYRRRSYVATITVYFNRGGKVRYYRREWQITKVKIYVPKKGGTK